MDAEKLQNSREIARDLRRCDQLKLDAAAVIDFMAAALEACAEPPAPNTAVRLELLNEIINLTTFYLNGHQKDIISSLVYEAAQGHTCDDPETIAHSRELVQITRETPRNSLPGKIYRAIVLALVPVICPGWKRKLDKKEKG